MNPSEGIREAHPESGELPDPQKGEVGFAKCQYGHIGQTFTVGDDTDLDIPKGQFNPYCVGCIMLHVIKQAKLKPMQFYIATREAVERQKQEVAKPELLVPRSGLIIPEGAMPPPRRTRGR